VAVSLCTVGSRSPLSVGTRNYCIYTAPNEEMVREHARKGGFPANQVSEVATIISPKTAEG